MAQQPTVRPRMKVLFQPLSILLIAGLVACSPPPAAPEPVRAVRTMTVGLDRVGGAFEYAAEVRARTESRLGCRVAGKIASRSANLGDNVRAGQVLAQLDPADLRLSLEAAQANGEEVAASDDPHTEIVFDREWALRLIQAAFAKVEGDFAEAGRAEEFAVLRVQGGDKKRLLTMLEHSGYKIVEVVDRRLPEEQQPAA